MFQRQFRLSHIHLIVGTAIVIILPGSAYAQFQKQISAKQEFYGLPKRLNNLGGLTPLIYRQDMSRLQKTDALLTWLVEERRNPSATSTGGGGGQIDAGYIQAQIIKGLSQLGDPFALEQIALSPQLADNDIRDSMRLALAMMGDRRQIATLKSILGNHAEPYFRALAAEGLHNLGTVEAMQHLQHALNDEFSVPAANDIQGSYTSYPVREAASEALRALRKADFVALAQSRNHKFAIRLGEERKYAAVPRTAISRLLEVANRSKRVTIAQKSPKR